MTPHRDKAYLAFVRQNPCCLCGAHETSAHHAFGSYLGGGKSIKGSDYGAVPLCVRCHVPRVHAQGPTDEEVVLMARAIADGLVRYAAERAPAGSKALRIHVGAAVREFVNAMAEEVGL